MVFISVPVTFYSAPVSANIIINNVPYVPQNPLQNINDRLLLPFREISEAIGADVLWDAPSRRITTTFGNRYSIMHIDSPIVTYGTFTRNSLGDMVLGEPSTMLLEVMPQLVDGLTYIPLRAFAETLGADVNWSAATSTAFIAATPPSAPQQTDPGPTAPNEPDEPDEPERPSNFGDFANTSFFRIISGSAVRNMYMDANNNPFAVVIYNSSLESSKYIVPNIQDVAQRVGFQVHGVDMADTSNRELDNAWIWTYHRQAQFQDPTIYFVHRRGRVEQIQAPTNLTQLEDRIRSFSTEVETGIAHGDFSNTAFFVTRTDNFIQREISDRNEFIVVFYNSREAESAHYIPIIKAAAARREIMVHGLDVDRHPNFHRNIEWFSDFRDNNDLPIMFLVYRNRNDMRSFSRPLNVNHAVANIDEFVENSGSSAATGSQFNDVGGNTGFFRNENIVNLRNRQFDNTEFLMFIYDSSDNSYREFVDTFAAAAAAASSSNVSRVYGINRSSNNFNQNHVESNFHWLDLSNAILRSSQPYLVRVERNGNITAFPASVNNHRTAATLTTQMWQWLTQN